MHGWAGSCEVEWSNYEMGRMGEPAKLKGVFGAGGLFSEVERIFWSR